MMNDRHYMKKALGLAEESLVEGEFPVGCIIVYEDQIIATGQRTHSTGPVTNEIDHAEINTLRQFSKIQADIDPGKTTLFCNLEPCLMCFGAILISRIGRVVYAYEDAMGGGTNCHLASLPSLYNNHQIEIVSRIMRDESLALFADFFNNPKNQYWKDSKLARYTLKQFSLIKNT